MILRLDPGAWLWFVVCIFATWRVTALLVYESGPLGVFVRVRRALYRLRLGRMLECFHCTGVWVGLAIVLLSYVPSKLSVLLILGVSGGASVAERLTASGSDEAEGDDDE